MIPAKGGWIIVKTPIVKRLAAMFLALGLLATLPGCKNGRADRNGIEEIVVTYYVNSTIANDLDMVEQAINAITEPSIGVRVDLQPISLGTYNEQVNLMLSGTERMDLFMISGQRFATYAANGQCIPLNGLLDQYGQGIIDAVGPDFLKGGAVDGQIYGVMPMRDIARGAGFYIRKDYVEKYGLDLSTVRTLADVEPILAAIKDAEPDLYPLVIERNPTLTPVELTMGKDNLSDGFGVLMYDDPGTVVNYFATEQYRQGVSTMRRWYEAGYIPPDVTSHTESIATQMKAGTGVCYFYMTKTGMDVQESKACGHEIVHADIVEPNISTANVQLLTWGVAAQSKHPEAAVKFLNLLYTDKDVLNLLDWGLEGRHYVFTEDGHITYPEGVDAGNSGYNINMSWAFGSQFNSYIWEGNDLDIWEQSMAAMSEAPASDTLGFTFDSRPVRSEVAALSNVAAEFRLGLETGAVGMESLSAFISKLEEAGIDAVVAEKQRQLDGWLESG